MEEIHLSFACSRYDRVEPLVTGEVKPKNITLHYVDVPSPDIFYHQAKFSRWDLSEMSFSFFLIARSRGWPYRILPVFHNRAFIYTTLQIHADAGIKKPEDLKGKRIGVFDYQQTAALHLRGQLEHEFGVKPTDMIWYQERTEEHSIGGGVGGFEPPPGLDFRFAPTDFATMFLNREIDAGSILHHPAGSSLERPKRDLTGHPKLKLLFRDPKAEAIRYYKKSGVYPHHHTTAIRESIIQEHPWVATSLMEAFEEAKSLASARLLGRGGGPLPSLRMFGRQELDEQRRAFGDDPYKYGVKANAKSIDNVLTYSVEQGLTPRKQSLEEIFPEEVLIAEQSLG